MPAITSHGAVLLDECEVLNLDASARAVTRAVCTWRGQPLVLRGDIFVLAAGALESPRILLRSASRVWPEGLANRSGLVGKNLMRHFVDLWLVFTESEIDSTVCTKEIAFNDFYSGALTLGSVQSFGRLPSARMLTADMIDLARNGRFPILARFMGGAGPLLQKVVDRMSARSLVLATVVEDFPNLENRINRPTEVRSPPSFYYRISDSNRKRIALMRASMKHLLNPYRYTLIRQAENSQRLAHVCGTCRFGTHPESSVLDAQNRAHGIANLYVVDSSFFPSSGGTNPGLTIAANALRVADSLG